jgi:holo-[acyl-carrier protein] synthase
MGEVKIGVAAFRGRIPFRAADRKSKRIIGAGSVGFPCPTTIASLVSARRPWFSAVDSRSFARRFFEDADNVLARSRLLQYDTPQEERMAARIGYNVGVDLVSVTRMEGIMARWGRKFLHRVFTADEIEYCGKRYVPARSFAARFAAKEAFVKAVSRKEPGGIRYRDVEVVMDEDGVPALRPHGTAKAALGEGYAEVSLSHEENLAVAVVITCSEVAS